MSEKEIPTIKQFDFETQVSQRQGILFGRRYVGSSISKISAPDWAQVSIMDFMRDPKNFLVYCGTPGIGKTYLCAALVQWAMKRFGCQWRYWTEDGLLQRLREQMDSGIKGDYLQHLKFLIDDEFLMIDDIGSSTKITEWREEVLFAILDYRYNSMLPTLITSNFSEQEFINKYHARIHSRLFSKDNTIIEIHNGVDFRLQERSKVEYKIEKINPT